ncbi:LPS export ABC transporter periplasmic protein LptC [Sulfurovum sp. bin170]|uniref:LPS export ABC transporter periplasmic protein LptC n=1 Tax=Sulfurovum sp. bin170 TaxID=2695268 RepID=UPI0013E01AF1|nr:LPS export ABC transporter periplasmic protein LptC [Sulfurovum sp. bin170]NEW60254.1 LPS export ABC transporter periplasmic protein LptC [Sulfurovum sp. bin170]
MVLRVEYILVVSLVILFGFIFMEQPNDVKAIESNSSKELYFKNLSLIDLSEKGIENRLVSSSVIKDGDSFEFEDIDITYKQTHRILAKKAIYRDDFVYLEDNISLRRDDGFSFVTDDLKYSMEEKIASTDSHFRLDMNGSRVSGEKLYYNLDREEVSADRIDASIIF